MSFWDDLVNKAEDAVSSKGNEVGDYLGGVLTDIFVKVGEPKTGNQTAAELAQQQQAAKVTSMLTMAIPLGVALVAFVMLSKRGLKL